MFYTDPTGMGFVDFPLPAAWTNMKIENMVLVEPFFIYALGVDSRGNESFMRYDFMNYIVEYKERPTISHDTFTL